MKKESKKKFKISEEQTLLSFKDSVLSTKKSHKQIIVVPLPE